MAEMTVDTATPIEGSVRRYTEQHPCQFNYLRTCNSKLDPSQTNNLERKGCTSSSNDLLWEVAMKVAESLEGFSGDNDLFLTLSKLLLQKIVTPRGGVILLADLPDGESN